MCKIVSEMDQILPILFLDDEGGPLEFSIRGPLSQFSMTVDLIKRGGGVVYVKRDGPHTIILSQPIQFKFSEEEFYNAQYISDCCEENVLLDLNKYRLNKDSKYESDFDANLILLKKKSWKDIPLRPNEEEDDEDAAVNDSVMNFPSLHSRSSKTIKTVARPYRECERLAIINWIIKNRVYSSVGGNVIWMEMEEKEVCEGRTWQSLKEHFKKKILPSIETFGLSAKHVRYFKKSLLRLLVYYDHKFGHDSCWYLGQSVLDTNPAAS